MKVTVDVDKNKIDDFLNYLKQNNIKWSKESDEILKEELSENHIAILSKRIEAAKKDPSRLRPIEEFYTQLESSL